MSYIIIREGQKRTEKILENQKAQQSPSIFETGECILDGYSVVEIASVFVFVFFIGFVLGKTSWW